MKILNRLNSRKSLISKIPVNKFFRFSDFPILSKGINPNTYLYLNRPPMLSCDMVVNREAAFKMGDVGIIYYLYSDPDFMLGYIIQFQSNVKVQYCPTYLTTVKQSKEGDLLPVSHILNTSGMSVYKVGVDFTVVSLDMSIVNHLL